MIVGLSFLPGLGRGTLLNRVMGENDSTHQYYNVTFSMNQK